MDFKDILAEARLSPQKAAQYLNLSRRTIDRYISTGRAPRPVLLALSWLAGLNPDWLGWRFQGPYIERHDQPRLHRSQVEQLEYMQYIAFRRGQENQRLIEGWQILEAGSAANDSAADPLQIQRSGHAAELAFPGETKTRFT